MIDPARRSKSLEDPVLFARMRDGDIAALGVLYDRYDADVRRLISRLGVAAGDVDDLVQLTFLDAMRSAGHYDGRASGKTWLCGIAVNIVRRHRRSVSRLLRRLTAWATEPPDERAHDTPERDAVLSEAARRAQRALERLSDKKRQVFVLVALEGLSGEEVAAALGIPVATVWTRLHHARRELRESLSREES